MGTIAWDLGAGFSSVEPVRNPRLTIRFEYPDMAPTEVTFGLSPRYGLHTARDAHECFLRMMREQEEFEIERTSRSNSACVLSGARAQPRLDPRSPHLLTSSRREPGRTRKNAISASESGFSRLW